MFFSLFFRLFFFFCSLVNDHPSSPTIRCFPPPSCPNPLDGSSHTCSFINDALGALFFFFFFFFFFFHSIAGVEDAEDLETVDDGQGAGKEVATDEDAGERKALWSQLKGMIGADVMSLFSVPVFIMEPTTTLQKMAEIMQYAKLLDVAADEEDEDMRLALVCALAVSTYSSNERTKKPFNPLLGETWECVLPDIDGEGGATYVSEQVCHHPPIGAGHASSKKWKYDITSMVKTKFMGNWVDVWPMGRTRIRLERTGEVFNICPPPSRVNNVIMGRTWIDTFGEMQVNNLNSGASALIKFKECNMFGMGRWEVSGDILGADGEVKYHLKGHWNQKAGGPVVYSHNTPHVLALNLRLDRGGGKYVLLFIGCER